jgi:hypothetical protein
MMFSTNASRFVLVLAAACKAVTSAQEAVNLGTAGDYVILAKTGISSTPESIIIGNIGVSPMNSTAMTGFVLSMDPGHQFSTSPQLLGDSQAHAASYGGQVATVLTKAVGDMEAAYNDIVGRTGDADKINNAGGNLGPGGTNPMAAGVYAFNTDVAITRDIYLSGDESSVFIFRTSGSLKQLKSTHVILEGNINPENVFWQIGGNLVVEKGAHMAGIILVKNDAMFQKGSSLEGRVLTQKACDLVSATVLVL